MNPIYFDYSKALKNLPHVNNRKKRPVPGKSPEEFTGIYWSFREKFFDSESLFNASKDEVLEVDMVHEEIAEAIYHTLQEMKKDPDYFINQK